SPSPDCGPGHSRRSGNRARAAGATGRPGWRSPPEIRGPAPVRGGPETTPTSFRPTCASKYAKRHGRLTGHSTERRYAYSPTSMANSPGEHRLAGWPGIRIAVAAGLTAELEHLALEPPPEDPCIICRIRRPAEPTPLSQEAVPRCRFRCHDDGPGGGWAACRIAGQGPHRRWRRAGPPARTARLM